MNRLWISAVLVAGLFAAPPAWAAQEKTKEAAKEPSSAKSDSTLKFMRVVRDARGNPKALETATGHYVSTGKGKPFIVDLIGAIHVGDKKYYESLNEQFKHYDVVLFELVMPEGETLKDLGHRKSNHPIAQFQQSLPSILNLAYQLKEIDYTPQNFVHADLSPDAMAAAIKARGETGTSVIIKAFFEVLKESNRQASARSKDGGGELAQLQLFAALFDSNRPLMLKRLMADQMDLLETGTGLGPTLDTILVKDRNEAAMKVLDRTIKKGTTKIGIFYGAAHMPDFDRRLTNDFKLKRDGLTWSRAWDLSGK
jgi:hypothetical protein